MIDIKKWIKKQKEKPSCKKCAYYRTWDCPLAHGLIFSCGGKNPHYYYFRPKE